MRHGSFGTTNPCSLLVLMLLTGLASADWKSADVPEQVRIPGSATESSPGTWTIKGDVVSLEIKPNPKEKMPDTVPGEFVVLGTDPVSIGERAGDLICPYRRID